MIIYGALIIPFIAAIYLYKNHKHKMALWEFLVPIAATLIFTFSMKAIIEHVQVTSTEYWGSFVDRVEYYEDWNEYIHRTCTTSCGKNCTTTYDCSYVQYHSAYYQIITTTGEKVKISKAEYNKLKKKYGNVAFTELNRHSYTNDGDKYHSKWEGDSIKATPVTTLHSYENRIKASDQSVFHFEEVDKKDVKRYALKEYPEMKGYKLPAVIGDNSNDAIEANKKFQYINGLLGHKKQVRFFILIFKDQPINAALYQEWYWSGGNKNEFVICVGIDSERNVNWCKPISWTRSEIMKSEVKSFVEGQDTLNLNSLAEFIQVEAAEKFERRHFKEFDYLTVNPPTWAVLLTYILVIGINIGLGIYVIRNEYD